MRMTLGKAAKKVEKTNDQEYKNKYVATRMKHKARRGTIKKNMRITGVTTHPSYIAAGAKSEETGHANRDMASSVQNDGPPLSS